MEIIAKEVCFVHAPFLKSTLALRRRPATASWEPLIF